MLYNHVPGFATSPVGSVRLTATSALVDAGDPLSDYSEEPSPNGCRVNLGAYGNTPEAAVAPNATHCN